MKNKKGRPQKYNYCDRDKLRVELMVYKETGVFSNDLINMFQKIINGYASLYFMKKEVKEDKKGEAMLHLLKYVHNYDENLNAFAYVTQIIKNAFRYYHRQFESKHEVVSLIIDDENKNFTI